MINIADDVENVTVSDDGLKRVSTLANDLLAKQAQADELEKQLKALKSEVFVLETETLPDVMLEVGVSTFALTNGRKVEVKPYVQGTVPTLGTIEKAKGDEKQRLLERRAFTLNWLRTNKHGGIIKCEVTVSFGKGQEKEAEKAVAALTKLGYAPWVEDSVHPSTFCAWARELNERGESLPYEDLGLFVGRKATVK